MDLLSRRLDTFAQRETTTTATTTMATTTTMGTTQQRQHQHLSPLHTASRRQRQRSALVVEKRMRFGVPNRPCRAVVVAKASADVAAPGEQNRERREASGTTSRSSSSSSSSSSSFCSSSSSSVSRWALVRKTEDANAVAEAVRALHHGSIIAVPTDTLYGFACDASNSKAIEKLYAIKGREKTKPVAVCVSRAEEVKKICELEGKIEESLLRKLLPGAVTLLFKRKWTETTLSKSLNPNVDNVGVRVPDCAFILAVCKAFDGAVALTSANTSGKPSCVDVSEFRELHEKCERVFDGGKIIEDDRSTDSALLRAGSTVVDLSRGNGTFQVVRDGCALENTTTVLLEYGFVESKRE